MKFKDYIRFNFNKFFSKKPSVFFAIYPPWRARIKSALKKDGGFYFYFDEVEKVDVAKFDVFLPLTIDAARYANKHLNLDNSIIPSNKSIDLCDDKLQFHKTLDKIGFRKCLPIISDTLIYPYVLKKSISAYGEDTFIIYNKECEEKYAQCINSSEYIKQEFISGFEEFTTHIFFCNNEIIYAKTFCFEFSEPYYVKGGLYREKSRKEVSVPGCLPIFGRILEEIGYQGICCFNYKMKDGTPKIFEINPRFGASLIDYMPDILNEYVEFIRAENIRR